MKSIKKYIIFVLFLAVIIDACSLRDAELPVNSRTTFIPPTSPDLVMINMQYAISERDINNYMKCFIDTIFSSRKYIYQADPSSGIQYPVFQNWNIGNEKSYYNALLSLTNENSNSNLFFSNPNINVMTDSAIYDADYLLHFDHQKPNVAKTLKGKIRLVLSPDTRNLWGIHKWIDIKSENDDTTWSVLKANFSN